MNKQAAWERKDHYELAVVPAALTGESVAKAAQHDSDSGPNPGSTYASNNGKRATTHQTHVLGGKCAGLGARGLLRACVRLKDLPKLALTLANDLQEVPR